MIKSIISRKIKNNYCNNYEVLTEYTNDYWSINNLFIAIVKQMKGILSEFGRTLQCLLVWKVLVKLNLVW